MADTGVVRRRGRLLVFPVLVLLSFLVLVGLDLNGSSISELGGQATDHSLVAGGPRSVRTDEWLVQTPNAIGNVRRGLPVQPWFGLVRVREPAVTLGSPSRDWSEVLKPQDWGYFMGASRGLAWHWWFSFLVGLLGLYALLVVLLGRALLAAALAVVGTFTPYSGWWSAPSTAMLLGYAAGATACALLALQVRTARTAGLLGAAGGLLLGALALTLYPPWQVSVGLVCLGLGVGQVLDRRPPWRRVATTCGAAAAFAGLPLLLWYVQNKAAIAATTSTFYPGSRISTPGLAKVVWLVDAPLNPWFASDAGKTLRVAHGATGVATFVNQSETSSSWLPVVVLAALVVAVAWIHLQTVLARRRAGQSSSAELSREAVQEPGGTAPDGAEPQLWTFWLVTAAMALLTAWAVLPVPAIVGRLTLLDRVPPWRLPLALGFAALLMVALGGQVLRRHRFLVWQGGLLALAALATMLVTAVSAAHLPWNRTLVPTGAVLVSGLVVGVGFAVVASGRGQRIAACLFAVYCFWSWALVNPLYHGLGPLLKDPVVTAMSAVEKKAPDTKAAVYGTVQLSGLVSSSGVQNLSGTTFYPDPTIWARLAPSQRNLWNNYASFRWVALPPGSATHIKQDHGTSMQLQIDPCGSDALSLGITWVLSMQPLTGTCLAPVDTLASGLGAVYRYRVAAGS